MLQTLTTLTSKKVDEHYPTIIENSKNKSKDIVNIFKVACENHISESGLSLLNQSILDIKLLHENCQLTRDQIYRIVQLAKISLPKEHEFNQSAVFNFKQSSKQITINKLMLSTIPHFKKIEIPSQYPQNAWAPIKILETFLRTNRTARLAGELPSYEFKDLLRTYATNFKNWHIPELTNLFQNELLEDKENVCAVLNAAFYVDDQTLVKRCLENFTENFELQDDYEPQKKCYELIDSEDALIDSEDALLESSKDERNHELYITLFEVACQYPQNEDAKTLRDKLVQHIELKLDNNELTKEHAYQIVNLAIKYLPEDHPFCATVTLISHEKKVEINRLVLLTLPHFRLMFQSGMKESKNSTINFFDESTAPLEILEMLIKGEEKSDIKAKLESFKEDELLDIYQRSTHEWEDQNLTDLIFKVLQSNSQRI